MTVLNESEQDGTNRKAQNAFLNTMENQKNAEE